MRIVTSDTTGAKAPNNQTVPIGFLDDLHQSMSRDAVLQTYSFWSRNLIEADRCSIGLSEGGETLRVTAMNGTRGVPEGTLQPLDATVVGQVFLTSEPLYIPDVARMDFPDAKVVSAMGYKSAVVTPIAAGGACFGTLSASFKHSLSEPLQVLAMLSAMARCLAAQLLLIDKVEELSHIARTDALTGASNRHALREEVEIVWAAWRVQSEPFAIISIDLDHFKSINDTHGHDVGDAVLKQTAKRLAATTNNAATFYRLGGEEFAALYRAIDLEQACNLGQRMLQALRGSPMWSGDLELDVTASFGVAGPVLADTSFNDTLKRADRALYQAKAAGRNQMCLATT